MHLRWQLGALAGAAVFALTVGGCASIDVNSYVERGVDLRQYRTFAWGPADALSTGDPRLDNNRFFDERVRTDVETRLAEKGFVKETSASPDLLVHYHARVTQQINASDLDPQYGYCDNGGCEPYVFEAGTLLIDLVDARTRKLVWRGWAKRTVDGLIDNQEWMEKTVDDAVARILATLPPSL